MKVYKLNGLEKYTVAFSKEDAVFIFILSGMGITVKNVIETDIKPNRDAVGSVFDSVKDLQEYFVEY